MKTWNVPLDSIISKVDVYVSFSVLQWMQFTTNTKHVWEVGIKPTSSYSTILFAKDRPFVGIQTYSSKSTVFAVSFLSYACIGKYLNPPLLPMTFDITSPIIILPETNNNPQPIISNSTIVQVSNSTIDAAVIIDPHLSVQTQQLFWSHLHHQLLNQQSEKSSVQSKRQL